MALWSMLCSPTSHWVINQHRSIPDGLWLTSTDKHWHIFLVYLSYLQRLLKFPRRITVLFILVIWYLPLPKNSAFNHVNIHQMLTEWIHESHRSYLSQWLEMLRRFWRKCPEFYFIGITKAPSRDDFLERTLPAAKFWGLHDDAPPVMRSLVCHNWLILRCGRRDICEIGIASEGL